MNKYTSGTNPNTEGQQSSDNFSDHNARLILYNDDVNEYSYVISCIIEILDCSDQQAEQLTMIAHYKGSVVVKEGSAEILSKLSQLMKDKGLTTAVLQNEQK